ncbi:MAG: cytochrome P450 [Candidatus Nitrosocosmicus sp.]
MNESSKKNRNLVFPPGPSEIIPYRLALKFISNPLSVLTEIFNKYGDISHFKFGPRLHVYLINNVYHIEDILVKHNSNFIKSPGLRLAKRVVGNGLITSEGNMHAIQRRMVQDAFNKSRMKTYGKIISYDSFEFIKNNWKDGQVLNIHKEMTKLTLSIISKILFGSNTLTLSDIDRISDYITVLIEYINKLRLPFLRPIEVLPLPLTIKYKQALRGLNDLIFNNISEHRKIMKGTELSEFDFDYSDTKKMKNQYPSDMLSVLLKSSYDSSMENKDEAHQSNKTMKMTDQQLRDEVMTIFLAGHETTANALTWTLCLLASNPKIESRIIDEVVSIIGSKNTDKKTIEFEDASKLKYTEMVLMESMRLYPPSWAIGRQAIEDYIIDNKYVVPSGSVLVMSQYLVHRDSRYFSRPDQFCPERWTPDFKKLIPRFSYFPFGGGPRACIGEPLAWIEGVIILATIVKDWKINLEEKMGDIELQPQVTLRPKNGIRAKLLKRNNL